MQGARTETRQIAQARQHAGSRAFRDCHTRGPRAPYPFSTTWALIGRDLGSWVLIGAAKCLSPPPPAPSCKARRPPASKVLKLRAAPVHSLHANLHLKVSLQGARPETDSVMEPNRVSRTWRASCLSLMQPLGFNYHAKRQQISPFSSLQNTWTSQSSISLLFRMKSVYNIRPLTPQYVRLFLIAGNFQIQKLLMEASVFVIKEGAVCRIARPKTPRVNSSQDQIQVASENTHSGSLRQRPASGARLPASCGQELPLFSQQAVGGLEPRKQSEAHTPASFLPCSW
nr:uncharacterized protein LOC112132015 isoform X1 [Pongo abelii]